MFRRPEEEKPVFTRNKGRFISRLRVAFTPELSPKKILTFLFTMVAIASCADQPRAQGTTTGQPSAVEVGTETGTQTNQEAEPNPIAGPTAPEEELPGTPTSTEAITNALENKYQVTPTFLPGSETIAFANLPQGGSFGEGGIAVATIDTQQNVEIDAYTLETARLATGDSSIMSFEVVDDQGKPMVYAKNSTNERVYFFDIADEGWRSINPEAPGTVEAVLEDGTVESPQASPTVTTEGGGGQQEYSTPAEFLLGHSQPATFVGYQGSEWAHGNVFGPHRLYFGDGWVEQVEDTLQAARADSNELYGVSFDSFVATRLRDNDPSVTWEDVKASLNGERAPLQYSMPMIDINNGGMVEHNLVLDQNLVIHEILNITTGTDSNNIDITLGDGRTINIITPYIFGAVGARSGAAVMVDPAKPSEIFFVRNIDERVLEDEERQNNSEIPNTMTMMMQVFGLSHEDQLERTLNAVNNRQQRNVFFDPSRFSEFEDMRRNTTEFKYLSVPFIFTKTINKFNLV